MKRTLEDRLAIRETVERYGFHLDDKDFDALRSILTEDAVLDFRDHRLDPPRGLSPFVGADEIIRQFREVVVYGADGPFQHIIVSSLVEDVSEDEAVVRSKVLCPMPDQLVIDVEYRDVVVRTPDGWKIKHKTCKRYNPNTAWPGSRLTLNANWLANGAVFEGTDDPTIT
ncbi:nuclear transport factor 2 family protein [Pseudonocardia halophobica]|uniref:nuclear transport factor 2 family protein n=1 Tax=Pseudonocardia halophobica TaxID=29401 RepID=UPI0022F30538|nr:nuclear transport factor 2 family protein [Pseudonocardia halophobica]